MNFIHSPRVIHSPSAASFISSALIHKQVKEAPILYITGSRTYDKGVLIEDKEQCTEASLWKELTSKQLIIPILKRWKQRTLYNEDIEDEVSMRDLAPFRMVLHRTNKMKLSYTKNGGMKGSSKCKYFVLMWIPSNTEDGMNEKEFNELIIALRRSRYFVNKLNKECIYISGPSYGNNEESKNNDRPNDCNDDSEEKFDLIPLSRMCRSCMEFTNDTILDIEVVVHELDREKFKTDQDGIHHEFDLMDEDDGYKAYFGDLEYEAPKVSIELKEEKDNKSANNAKHRSMYSWHQQASKRRISFGGSHESQFETQPLSHESYGAIYSKKSGLRQEFHVFAFVWFTPKKKININDIDKVSNNKTNIKHTSPSILRNDLSQSLIEEEEEEKDENGVISNPVSQQTHSVQSEQDRDFHDGVLPALSVMNKLHQQPYDGSRIYNIELMGYDECYENLDLVVDRRGLWKDAFLVFIQALFLPLFIIIPPIRWIKLCNKDFMIRPRYRPVGDMIPDFEDLDRTEQIPYDITALWKSFRIEKSGRYNKTDWKRKCCFRFLSALIALIVWGIVFGGPFLYRRARNADDAKNLLFFDCFGPLIFYGLGVFTVMWWACHSRVLIGPKEHLLLYNKFIVYRPIRRKEDNYNTPRTDWAALTNLSQPTLLSAFTYGYRKGFMELRTPTHELLSMRRFQCDGKKASKILRIWILYTTSIIVYFGAQNLENFEEWKQPFYVDKSDKHYHLRLIYCILSNILSWILLWCFILLWETMIDRISRQHENVKTLSNLIIRNTYSEYIEFDYIDNILSWLALENFVKRKGMMLFSSLETPLFSLFVLSLISWGSTFYCIFEGVGLNLNNDNSLFSNSALATWFYLATLSLVQVSRMLYYGHQFNRESEKQDAAIKSQCGTIHGNNLMQFLKKDKLSMEQKFAVQSAQILLTHINHNDIVPKVFGVSFDKLTAKAAWTAIISAIPTIATFIAGRITF